VAVIEISGGIFDPKETLDELNRFTKTTQALIAYDSPDAAVLVRDHQVVLWVKEKKKVIVSMGTVAASGGYYIAVAADKIIALPGTITGSIGVLMDYTNLEELLKFLKIHAEILKSGKMKDVGSPLRSLTPEEREYLQSLLDDMHRQFIEAVAKGRKQPVMDIEKLATAGFTGEQALVEIDRRSGASKRQSTTKDMLGLKERPELYYPKKSERVYRAPVV
jgi:protease-4